MEGPCIRRFPRILLNNPVEVRSDDTVILLDSARGNLSVGGLFVSTQGPTPSGSVYLRIAAQRPFESEGVVRHFVNNGCKGVGIEFTNLQDARRKDLEQLIAELTGGGAPAA